MGRQRRRWVYRKDLESVDIYAFRIDKAGTRIVLAMADTQERAEQLIKNRYRVESAILVEVYDGCKIDPLYGTN